MQVKKIIVGIMVICVISLCFSRKADVATGVVPDNGKEPLVNAMAATGAVLEAASLNAWAELPEAGADEERMTAMLQSVMADFGLAEGSYHITRLTDQSHRQFRAEGSRDGCRLVSVIQAVTLKPPLVAQTMSTVYLVLNVETESAPVLDIPAWRQKLTRIITHFGGLPRITTCLVGYLDGKLMEDDWGTYIDKAFVAVNGVVANRLVYDNFASYAGYSFLIPDKLDFGGEKVNVNVAMRYSRYQNRTYITIGSPVITREY